MAFGSMFSLNKLAYLHAVAFDYVLWIVFQLIASKYDSIIFYCVLKWLIFCVVAVKFVTLDFKTEKKKEFFYKFQSTFFHFRELRN